MSELTLRAMGEPHGPGWCYESDDDGADWPTYQLWAPRPGRDHWSASWDRRRGNDGGFRSGGTAEEALTVMPGDAEGREAKAALLRAAAAGGAETGR